MSMNKWQEMLSDDHCGTTIEAFIQVVYADLEQYLISIPFTEQPSQSYTLWPNQPNAILPTIHVRPGK